MATRDLYDNDPYRDGPYQSHKLTEVVQEGFDYQNNKIGAQEERLQVIEARLHILHADLEMNKLYPELKLAYDNYKEIEQKILTFHTLKTST